MNMSLESHAIETLKQDIAQVPGIRIRRVEPPSVLFDRGLVPDNTLEITAKKDKILLLSEWRPSGQPRIARESVTRLSWMLSLLGSSSYGVFLAPYISSAAAGICIENSIGYADLAGNCHLAFGGVFIQREGRPNLFTEKRSLRTLYSPKAERILRVLLRDPVRAWKTRPLATEAGVSLGQVSKVRNLLEEREWITVGTEGISLHDPGSVLAEWADRYNPLRSEMTECYGAGEITHLEPNLAEICGESGQPYALTGFSAAARLAPSVRYRRASIYFSGSMEKLIEAGRLKTVDSGSNVTLLRPYDEGVYFGGSEVDGVRIVSPVQTYLDLCGLKGRGAEAAEYLLETEIRSLW